MRRIEPDRLMNRDQRSCERKFKQLAQNLIERATWLWWGLKLADHVATRMHGWRSAALPNRDWTSMIRFLVLLQLDKSRLWQLHIGSWGRNSPFLSRRTDIANCEINTQTLLTWESIRFIANILNLPFFPENNSDILQWFQVVSKCLYLPNVDTINDSNGFE